MTALERLWAYVTLGAMGSFWGEASPLLGGLAAFDRHLRLASVILAVAFGTWLGGLALYWVGKAYGRGIRKRWPRLRPVIIRSIAIVRRHPWRASLLSRFAYGLRLALPIACGVARLPLLIYALGTGISALVWSAAFTVLGWALGRTTETLIGRVREYEAWIAVGMLAAVLAAFVFMRRRHVEEKTVHVLDPDPERESSARPLP